MKLVSHLPRSGKGFSERSKENRFFLFVPVPETPVPAEKTGKEIDIHPHNHAEHRSEKTFPLRDGAEKAHSITQRKITSSGSILPRLTRSNT